MDYSVPEGYRRNPTEVADRMRERGIDPGRGTHGTSFKEGMTHILPADVAGTKVIHSAYSRPDRAYYTTRAVGDPEGAIHKGFGWAGRAAEENMEPHAWATKKVTSYGGRERTEPVMVRGRPVVHEVEAMGHIDEDPILNPGGRGGYELTADKLRITDTHWSPPASNYAEPGEQHTVAALPNVNWNRWSDPKKQPPYHEDANYHTEYEGSPYHPDKIAGTQERQQYSTRTKPIPGQQALFD